MDLDDSGLDIDGRSDEENRRKHQPISWNAWHKPSRSGDEHSSRTEPGYDRHGPQRDGPSSVIVKETEGSKDPIVAHQDNQQQKPSEINRNVVDVNWLMDDEKAVAEEKKLEIRPERKRDRSPSATKSKSNVRERTPPPPPGNRRHSTSLRPGGGRSGIPQPRKRPFSRTAPFLHPRGHQPIMVRPPPRPQMHTRLPIQKMRMPSHGIPRHPSGSGMHPRAMPPGVGLRHVPRPFPRVSNPSHRSIPPGYGPGLGKRGTRRPRSPPRINEQWSHPVLPLFEDPRSDMARIMRIRGDEVEPAHHPPTHRDSRSVPIRDRPPADTRRNWRAPSPEDPRNVSVPKSPRRRPGRDMRLSPRTSPTQGNSYAGSPTRTRARGLSPVPRIRRGPPWRERSRYGEPPPPPPREVLPPARNPYNPDRGAIPQEGASRSRESAQQRVDPSNRRTGNMHRRGDLAPRRPEAVQRRSDHDHSRNETSPQMQLRSEGMSRKEPPIPMRDDHAPAHVKDSHEPRRDSSHAPRNSRHISPAMHSQSMRDRGRDSPEPKRRALHRDIPPVKIARSSGWDRRESQMEKPASDLRSFSSTRRPDSHNRFVREPRERKRSESPRDYPKRVIDRSSDALRSSRTVPESTREPEGERRNNIGNGMRPPNAEFSHSEDECAWFYVDPQGSKQGPCTIEQFRGWLKTLAEDPQYKEEHKQFMSVNVWKEGMNRRYPMMVLLKENRPLMGRDRSWL